MHEIKELIDKISNIEKSVNVIEERTRKLEELDNIEKIEEAINQLRLELLQGKPKQDLE
jgi:hypothetical protein